MRKKVVTTAIVLLALLAFALLSGSHAVPEPPHGAPVPVRVVVADSLSWEDVASGEMPVARMLAEKSAVGLLVSHDPRAAATTLGLYGGAAAHEIGTRVATGAPAAVDEALAEVLADAPAGTAVVLVSLPSGQAPGVAVVSGGGYPSGYLESYSTRRAGIVTDEDIAATVLSMAGRGEEAVGSATSVVEDSAPVSARLERLVRMDRSLRAMERLRVPLQSAYTTFMALLVLAGWLLAERGRAHARYGYWSMVLRRALVFGLCVPAAGTLLHVVDAFPAAPERAVALLLASAAFVWIFAQFAWHRWGTAGALAFVGIVSAAVLALDQLAGAPLSVSGLFSYSPLAGFRFYGMGNEGAAILVGALMTGIALEIDAARPPVAGRQWTIAIAGAVAVFVAAAPVFGANAVVAVWGTIAFAALFVAVRSVRVRVIDVLGIAAAVVAAVAIVVAIDRLVPGATHVSRALGESPGGVFALLRARAVTSVRIFTASPLPAVVLALAAGFAALCARPTRRMRAALESHPVFARAIAAGLLGGAVGTVVEDSGLVVLALILLFLAGSVVALMLVPDVEEVPAV